MQAGRGGRIGRCTTDEAQGTCLLLREGGRLRVHRERVLAQVPDENPEHPVDVVLVETRTGSRGPGACSVRRAVDRQGGRFDDEPRVDDLGEELPDVEQEIEVLRLLPAWRCRGHQVPERLHLIHEGGDVRQV